MAETLGAALGQGCGGLAGGRVPAVAPGTWGQAASLVCSLCALCGGN